MLSSVRSSGTMWWRSLYSHEAKPCRFAGSKTSFADYLVQRFVEKREEIDLRRNASFAAFGFFYLGAWTSPSRADAACRTIKSVSTSLCPNPFHSRQRCCVARAKPLR